MANDLWFGDSWVIGNELGKHYGSIPLPRNRFPYYTNQDRPDLSYAGLVSNSNGNKYYNFGMMSSSIDFCVHNLYMFCKEKYRKNQEYNVYLSTTGQTRKFGIDETGRHNHYFPDPDDWPDSDAFATYRSTVALNNFYLLCKEFNLNLTIIPVWCEFELFNDINLVPGHMWLSEPNNPIVRDIFTIDKYTDQLIMCSKETITEDTKFIYPCECHPNLKGHELLANKIQGLLE